MSAISSEGQGTVDLKYLGLELSRLMKLFGVLVESLSGT